MEYHKYLIQSILEEECLEGFEKEQRRDELEHLSTETLENIRDIYKEERLMAEYERTMALREELTCMA